LPNFANELLFTQTQKQASHNRIAADTTVQASRPMNPPRNFFTHLQVLIDQLDGDRDDVLALPVPE
jgi:hypothetical protein